MGGQGKSNVPALVHAIIAREREPRFEEGAAGGGRGGGDGAPGLADDAAL